MLESANFAVAKASSCCWYYIQPSWRGRHWTTYLNDDLALIEVLSLLVAVVNVGPSFLFNLILHESSHKSRTHGIQIFGHFCEFLLVQGILKASPVLVVSLIFLQLLLLLFQLCQTVLNVCK